MSEDDSYIELVGLLQHSILCYNEATEIIEGKDLYDENDNIIKINTREEQLKEAVFRLELCNTLLDQKKLNALDPRRKHGDIIENIHQVKAESLLLYGNLIGWEDCLKAHKSYEEVVTKWDTNSYEGWLQYARSTWDLSDKADDIILIEKYLKRAIAIQQAAEYL